MTLIDQILSVPDTRDYLNNLLEVAKLELTNEWKALNDLSMNFSRLDYLWQLGFVDCEIRPVIIDGMPKGGYHYYRLAQENK